MFKRLRFPVEIILVCVAGTASTGSRITPNIEDADFRRRANSIGKRL
jgi:hypothetical protein